MFGLFNKQPKPYAGKIAIVVTNVDHYESNPSQKTGLWLSELAGAIEMFDKQGYRYDIISPLGGVAPLEPRSLEFPNIDTSSKNWFSVPQNKEALQKTKAASDVQSSDYKAVFFVGGHGAMYDFVDNEDLHRLIREIYEAGGIVSSVCHGYCALLEVHLSDGIHLIKGRKITGFSWGEEGLAGMRKVVPYNAEQRAKDAGALYKKTFLPLNSYIVEDDRLITGQNPASAMGCALRVTEVLDKAAK